mmetsp:Transcript_50176/g.51056  ORF Transcript_50176/g.51056 Transcript_50176/m.51056 type:complete len:136 (+) Transcript_50176:740-1147(+)
MKVFQAVVVFVAISLVFLWSHWWYRTVFHGWEMYLTSHWGSGCVGVWQNNGTGCRRRNRHNDVEKVRLLQKRRRTSDDGGSSIYRSINNKGSSSYYDLEEEERSSREFDVSIFGRVKDRRSFNRYGEVRPRIELE